ncbi:MAG: phage head-tail connector protein [Anaerotignaceae bacterium]
MAQVEQVATLKILLGITDESKDVILAFVIDKATDMVCNYCNTEEVPTGLSNVLLNMCVDMYRAESLGQEQTQGVVKGITEGDVSISFGAATSVSENGGMAFLKDYTTQLNRYRKVGW